jgi:integrase/recombinase XerD
MNRKSRQSTITARVVMRNDYTYADGTRTLYLQVFIDGQRRKYPMDIRLKPKDWHDERMAVRKSHGAEAADFNLVISHGLSRCADIAVKCRLEHSQITVGQFEKQYFTDQGESYLDFWASRMEQMKPQMAIGTWKHHRSVLKKVAHYCGDVAFSDVNHEWVSGFDRFLKKTYGNGFNTRAANMNKVRRYVNLAMAEGKMTKTPFDHYKISFQQGHRAVLSRDQLRSMVRLWEAKTLMRGRHVALQNFLLGCFTGLRIGDVYRVEKRMIEGNRLVFMPQKTSARQKVIEIPLTAMARTFIASGGDHLAERLSEQKTNEYLKEIAEMTGIRQRLSFKAARHTFATIYLELGGSVEVLQRLLGHAKLTTTMVYVHIADARKEAEMGLFDKEKWS